MDPKQRALMEYAGMGPYDPRTNTVSIPGGPPSFAWQNPFPVLWQDVVASAKDLGGQAMAPITAAQRAYLNYQHGMPPEQIFWDASAHYNNPMWQQILGGAYDLQRIYGGTPPVKGR